MECGSGAQTTRTSQWVLSVAQSAPREGPPAVANDAQGVEARILLPRDGKAHHDYPRIGVRLAVVSESAEPTHVVEVHPDSRHFAAVLQLARLNRRYLGFLPDAGFSDRARKGTLLAVVADQETLGYVLYDLPADRVKIVHLCVAEGRRRSGIARQLIDVLSSRHHDRRGLELACRRDFPANALWPNLGFRPVAERLGRSHLGHPLTIWLLEHGHPNLFTLTVEDQEHDVAAIDHNVFVDLVSDREQGRESRHLNEDWISEYVDLSITDEVLHEINQCENDHLRTTMQEHASGFRHLSTGSRPWRDLVPIAAGLAPGAEPADHRHVARAVAGGATYFVTRDDGLIEAAKRLQDEFQVIVLRPETLILRVDRIRSRGRYEPEALEATSIVAAGPDEIDQREFVAAFLNYGAGERAANLRQVLRAALATPALHHIRVFRQAGGLLGGLIRRSLDDHMEVTLIRVNRSDRLGRALARQLAFLPRQVAAEERLRRVIVSDPNPSAPVLRALPYEGYEALNDDRWVCSVQSGLAEASSVVGLHEDPTVSTAIAAARLERRRWPLKIVGAHLPVFMVSINPPWAEQLFDTDLAAATLFGRNLELGLSREHVYYRSPGAAGGIVHPARILWYVTGGVAGHEIGHVRAVSQLEEVVTGLAHSLYQRFARLGVWSEKQVLQAADANGRAMALRFVDTEVFARPVSLDELRDIYGQSGLEFSAPQSPRRVPEHTFCRLYARASSYAS
jgi:ribosomal protein S18 acetylase RimI-like enzyme